MPLAHTNLTDGGRPPSRQQLVGAASRHETRQALLQAAGELFAEQGYAKSTVAAIAKRAGASVQTLYLAWGSKRALLQGFAQTSLSGPRIALDDRAWAETVVARITERAGENPTPEVLLRGYAHQVRYFAEGDPPRPPAGLVWKLYRDAAATDPEVASDWTMIQKLRRGTCAGFLEHVPAPALRPDLDTDTALETLWAITSPEIYELFIHHAGHTADEYETWMANTLVHALLAPTSSPATSSFPTSLG